MTGILISFEGIEGSGKSTQLSLLEKFLKEKNYKVIATREPGGTKIGDQIRKILLNPENKNMHYLTEALLLAASRNQLVEEVIIPYLRKDYIILCDRFFDASIAYQCFGRQIDRNIIQYLINIATKGIKPEITFLLDLEVDEIYNRLNNRYKSNKLDRFEQEDTIFHKRVREGYLALAQEEPDRFFLIPANDSIEKIHQTIKEVVLNFINKRNKNYENNRSNRNKR